jgi:hypothetical protein
VIIIICWPLLACTAIDGRSIKPFVYRHTATQLPRSIVAPPSAALLPQVPPVGLDEVVHFNFFIKKAADGSKKTNEARHQVVNLWLQFRRSIVS